MVSYEKGINLNRIFHPIVEQKFPVSRLQDAPSHMISIAALVPSAPWPNRDVLCGLTTFIVFKNACERKNYKSLDSTWTVFFVETKVLCYRNM